MSKTLGDAPPLDLQVEDERPNLQATSLEENILLLLKNHVLYGLQIQAAIAEASNGRRKILIGSLYPALNRLEAKGFAVALEEETNKRGGANRVYYKITADGLAVLLENATIRENLRRWKPSPNNVKAALQTSDCVPEPLP